MARSVPNRGQWIQVLLALAVLSEAWTKDYIITRTDLIVFTVMVVISTPIALDTRRALRFVAWPSRFKTSDNYVEFIRIMAWLITGDTRV